MSEADAPQGGSTTTGAGADLRAARDAAGLSLAEVASRTRVPQRYLEAIERGDYAALPSPTYAVGFAKAYARAIGADEVAVANDVRAGVATLERRPEYEPYEVPDPARVPSRGVAIVGLGVALAVLILVGLWYGTDLLHGGTRGENAPAQTTVARAVPAPAAPVAKPAVPTGGQVVLTAGDDVWLRVYDADNKTLYLGTMKPGERFAVPATANDPMINVGRPDKLAVTLDGKPVPPLGTGERAIKDVKVSGTAIAARLAGAPLVTPTPTAASSGSARTTARRERTAPPPRRLTETQRANRESAAGTLPAADNASQ